MKYLLFDVLNIRFLECSVKNPAVPGALTGEAFPGCAMSFGTRFKQVNGTDQNDERDTDRENNKSSTCEKHEIMCKGPISHWKAHRLYQVRVFSSVYACSQTVAAVDCFLRQ